MREREMSEMREREERDERDIGEREREKEREGGVSTGVEDNSASAADCALVVIKAYAAWGRQSDGVKSDCNVSEEAA